MSIPSSRSSVTRNFAHLKPPHETKFVNKQIPAPMRRPQQFVQPEDRIAFWNIAPGDEVKLRTGRVGQDLGLDPSIKLRGEGVVQSLDKERNVLYLVDVDPKNPRAPKNLKHIPSRLVDESEPEKGKEPNVTEVPRPVHYSNILLRIPPIEGEDKNAPPRYAYRLERRNTHYNRHLRRWMWQRVGLVKEANGTTSRVEIPWPEPERPRPQNRPELTKRDVVEEETWLPWSPFDPVHLTPERPWASPISEVATRARREQLNAQAAEARRQADLERGDGVKRRLGTYAGFEDKLRGKKSMPVPQPPTASEILALAAQARSDWFAERDVAAHAENGGRSFAPSDYLDLAPRAGPAAAAWSLPVDADAERQGATHAAGYYRRDDATGRLVALSDGDGPSAPAHRLSRAHLDSLPIELLMRDDLENKHSRKHKQRRRLIRLKVEEDIAAKEHQNERREVFELRKVVKEKLAARDRAEKEAQDEARVANREAAKAAKVAAAAKKAAAQGGVAAAAVEVAPEVSEEIATQAGDDVAATTGEKTS